MAGASNCALAIVDDDKNEIVFWGEFSAGCLRIKESQKNNISKISIKKDIDNKNLTNFKKIQKKSNPKGSFAIPRPIKLPIFFDSNDKEVRAIASGTEHVLILTAGGKILTWGLNRYGQCGDGTNIEILTPKVKFVLKI